MTVIDIINRCLDSDKTEWNKKELLKILEVCEKMEYEAAKSAWKSAENQYDEYDECSCGSGTITKMETDFDKWFNNDYKKKEDESRTI